MRNLLGASATTSNLPSPLLSDRYKSLVPASVRSWLRRQLFRRGISLGRASAILSYLSSYPTRKLQLGAGSTFLHGWLNTDLLPVSGDFLFLDVTRPFPFENGTFDYIFAEHLIEHVPYHSGTLMLRECYRVLKPHGRIRIATPDLETIIGLHTPEKSDRQQGYVRWFIDKFHADLGSYREAFVINGMFYNFGHSFIYDRATLQISLEEAGFVDVTECKVGESDDENLRQLESHLGTEVGGDVMNEFETMVLEVGKGQRNASPAGRGA